MPKPHKNKNSNILSFTTFKDKSCPIDARGFCDNISLVQSIEKLTDRIVDQYNSSVAIGHDIDIEQAEINEYIIGVIRTTYQVSTEDIQNRIESSFNIKLTQSTI